MKTGGGGISPAMMMEAMANVVGNDLMGGMLELQQAIFALDAEQQKQVFVEMVDAGKRKAAELAQVENEVEEEEL